MPATFVVMKETTYYGYAVPQASYQRDIGAVSSAASRLNVMGR